MDQRRRLAVRRLAAGPCALRRENYQALPRSHDHLRHPPRMGGMDRIEVPAKRQILHPWRPPPNGDEYRKKPRHLRRTKRVDGAYVMSLERFQVITPTHPDYRNLVRGVTKEVWPEFMLHDLVANQNWRELFDRFLEYQFALYDTQNHRVAG